MPLPSYSSSSLTSGQLTLSRTSFSLLPFMARLRSSKLDDFGHTLFLESRLGRHLPRVSIFIRWWSCFPWQVYFTCLAAKRGSGAIVSLRWFSSVRFHSLLVRLHFVFFSPMPLLARQSITGRLIRRGSAKNSAYPTYPGFRLTVGRPRISGLVASTMFIPGSIWRFGEWALRLVSPELLRL